MATLLCVAQALGGAIDVADAHAELQNATFLSNHAFAAGGALFASSGAQVNANGSAFTSDYAYQGGGIYVRNSTLLANGATFTQNTAVRRFRGGVHTLT